MDEFVLKLKKLMAVRKINQKQLAVIMNSTEASVSRYLKGERFPRMDKLKALAEFFDVTTDYLVGLDPTEPRATDLRISNIIHLLSVLNEEDLYKAENVLRAMFSKERSA